jgi:hypothetical protein
MLPRRAVGRRWVAGVAARWCGAAGVMMLDREEHGGRLREAPKEIDVMEEKDRSKASTGTYRIRGMSRDLHRAARLRAMSQGTTLRWVVVQALQAYSAGTWTPPDEPRRSRMNGA